MIPFKGKPVISAFLKGFIHRLANSYVSIDTCVLLGDTSTPKEVKIFIYFWATSLSLITMSSPNNIY